MLTYCFLNDVIFGFLVSQAILAVVLSVSLYGLWMTFLTDPGVIPPNPPSIKVCYLFL